MQTFVIDNNLNILKQSTLKTATTGFDISTAVLTNDNLECYVLKSEEETKVVCNSADGKKTETRLNPSGELLPPIPTPPFRRMAKAFIFIPLLQRKRTLLIATDC
jgi:hypothetical protein